MTYSIGFTANLSIGNVAIPTHTNPVSIAESKYCVNLNNGLSKFMGSKKGLFTMSCLADTSTQRMIGFALYPNPTANNYVVVRLTAYSGTAVNFIVKVLGGEGRTGISRKATIAELRSGIVISLAGFQSGLHAIHISTDADKLTGTQKLIIIK